MMEGFPEKAKEGLAFRVQFHPDRLHPGNLHRPQTLGLAKAQAFRLHPRGQGQGLGFGEHLPGGGQLAEPFGQDHRRAHCGGLPRLAASQRSPEHLPAGHPCPGG